MPIKPLKTSTRPKILLTAIFKDDSEYEYAERMLESFMPYMSGLAVAITGLSGKHQKLQKLIKKHKGRFIFTEPTKNPEIYAKGEDGKWFFAHFAEARNASFKLAEEMQEEGKYDFWTWADTDDTLIGGDDLLQVAAAAIEKKMDCIQFVYWYSVLRDENGVIQDVLIDHYRDRLLKPGVFKWVSRLHEVSVPVTEGYFPRSSIYELDPKNDQKCVWVHLPPPTHGITQTPRNLAILELQYAEEKVKDPRTVFNLGKTYEDYARDQESEQDKNKYLDKAIELYHIYLKGPNPSGWEEERSNAWERLGNIARERGQFDTAVEYYLGGIKEWPQAHMLNFMLAATYFDMERYDKAEHWLEVSVQLPAPTARATINTPHEVKKIAAQLKYNLAMVNQKYKEALYWLDKMKALGADTGEMETKIKLGVEMNDAANWLFNYAKYLKRQGHTDKIVKLLDAVAPEMANEQFVHYLASEVVPPKVWPSKSIAYFAGPTFEQWSPKSLETGLGGSETAIVQLAKQWAQKGYEVTVFCDCGEDEGEYDGVKYVQWQKINWKDQFYIFVAWRAPQLLDKDIKAFNLLYDAHDIENALNWTPDRIEKVSKVFFKSAWHRSHVPKLPDSKAAIIHNGIEV